MLLGVGNLKLLIISMYRIRHQKTRIFKIIVLMTTMLSVNAFSQQLSLSSEYMFNQFLINPAATGNTRFLELRLNSRKQWTGFEGGPLTNSISAHKLLGNKTMGLGMSIFTDSYGPENRLGFKVSYSYIMPMKSIKSNLALGVAFHGFQYSINYDELEAIEDGDESLQQKGKETVFVPDADFGVYLYNKKYSVGISVNQLVNIPINVGSESYNDNYMIRHYYLMGSYLVKINEDFDIEPSALIKATEVAPIQADINLRLWYKQSYWVSVSYRSKTTVVGMLGVRYNNFVFGYAYDYYFNEIQTVQAGSHEIVLGYNFGQNLTSNALLESIRTF